MASQSDTKTKPGPSSARQLEKIRRQEELEKLCAEEISVPSKLPGILKQYTKGAIRTQPADLLIWSIAYFRCMQYGIVPPVKERVETSPAALEGKLTVGFLQVLHKQLSNNQNLTYNDILAKWKAICQDEKTLSSLFVNYKLDKIRAVEWKRVLPLLTTLLGKNMNEYMTMVCQVFSTRKDTMMNWDLFWEMYTTLARTLRKDGNNLAPDTVKNFLQPLAEANQFLIGPSNFNDPKCPTL